MPDVLRMLAYVHHLAANEAAEDLQSIANKQEENLKRKRQLRDLEKYYDSAVNSDGGVVTTAELNELTGWMSDLGIQAGEGLPASGDIRVSGGSDNEARQVSQNKELLESAIKDVITAAKEQVDDDQSQVQFEIQVATSDLQNAENVRSQAEKRLEQQRKDLTRNWAG